jgi:hypothetical protein
VNSSTPIVSHFSHKLAPGATVRRSFPCSIVISHEDAAQLPRRVGQRAHKVAEVVSDLTKVPETQFKLVGLLANRRTMLTRTQKNRHWWNSGKKYRRCEYDVKVIIGPADIIFELWFQQEKLSKDTPMPVEWMDAPAPNTMLESANSQVELPAMSRSRKVGNTVPSKQRR